MRRRPLNPRSGCLPGLLAVNQLELVLGSWAKSPWFECAAGLLTYGSTPSGAFPLRWSGTVAALGRAGKLPNYSGGPVPEFHRLPYSPRWLTGEPLGHRTLFCFRRKTNTGQTQGQVAPILGRILSPAALLIYVVRERWIGFIPKPRPEKSEMEAEDWK